MVNWAPLFVNAANRLEGSLMLNCDRQTDRHHNIFCIVLTKLVSQQNFFRRMRFPTWSDNTSSSRAESRKEVLRSCNQLIDSNYKFQYPNVIIASQ